MSGATAAEYALVIALIGTALAVAAVSLGGSIANAMNSTQVQINNCGTSGC